MRRFLIAALLAAGPAMADLVVRNGANELRSLNAECTHPGILPHLKPEFHPLFKRATATMGKQTRSACWIDTMDGSYFVIFEGGESVVLPITAFLEVGV